MIKKTVDWLLEKGLIFATLLVNLATAILVTLVFLIISLATSWWNKHT